MQKTILVTAFALLLGTGAAFAADGPRANVPAQQWLSPSEILSKLKQQGYDVTKIESDDGSYEVEMTDTNGTRIETHVNPQTGEVMPGYDD